MYLDKPPAPGLYGRLAIEDYWRDKVLPQRDIQLKLECVQFWRSRAFVEWEARFIQGGVRHHLEGKMVLEGDPSARLIRKLSESYRDNETSLS